MWRWFKRLFVLALLAAVGGGVAAVWLITRSDELLRDESLRQAQRLLPGVKLSIERASFDLRGRIRLYNVSVRLPSERRKALSIPEVVLTVDRKLLTEKQQVLIQSVRLSQPVLHVARDAQGRWNWQALELPALKSQGALPHVEIWQGRVEATTAGSAAPLVFEDVTVVARPAAGRRYAVQVTLQSEPLGLLKVHGDVPVSAGPWQVDGELKRVTLDSALLTQTLAWAPELAPLLQSVRQRLDQQAREFAAASGVPPAANGDDWGVSLTTRLNVRVTQTEPQAPPQYKVLAQILDGSVTHVALPFPLYGLTGKVFVDPQQVIVRAVKGQNGRARVEVDGRWSRTEGVSGTLGVAAVEIDDALVGRLPESLRRHVRSLALTGRVSGQVGFASPDGRLWTLDAEASLDGGTVMHERFQYPVRQISGTLSFHDRLVQFQAAGTAGGVPMSVVGLINNPGPLGDVTIDVTANNVPLDEQFLLACPAALQRTLRSLHLAGRGSGRLRVSRPAGPDRKYETELFANLSDCSVNYDYFPLPLQKVSGAIHWKGDVVTATKLRGEHDGAELTCERAVYVHAPDGGRLLLPVEVKNATFDRSLYAALPQQVREVWDAFAPQGRFHAQTRIEWIAGQPVAVELPRVQIFDAGFQLREFPYPFQDLTGEFAYAQSRVTIKQFSARHDDTRISGAGVADCGGARPWQVRFTTFHVDDLSPTPALRRALPSQLRTVVEALNPSGRVSAQGPVSFYGPERAGGSIAADWSLELFLAGCGLNAGLRLSEIHGRVQLDGRWSGDETELGGALELDSLAVLGDHQVTQIRGPFRLQGNRLVLGSEVLASGSAAKPEQRVTTAQRLTGKAFDGSLTLDASVDFRGAEPAYQAHFELTGASLERYAHQHLRGYSTVRGLMNGWMDIRGRGVSAKGLEGEGQLQISPAALYELPVFLQIFQLPQFQPIDRTAFKYANFFFTIANERYNFQSIDLVGNAFSLRGRGNVRFDGMTTLDFYTMQPRNPVRFPGVRELVGVVGMVSQGWMAVEVRGPITAPLAKVVPFPALDNAMQQFLGILEPRPLPTPPPLRWGPPRATDNRSTPPR